MDPYRLLLEECGIYDHEIPIDVPSSPSTTRDETEYGLDYNQEIEFNLNYKRKHRYSRKDRFKYIMYQLVGLSGETPRSIINLVKRNLPKKVRKYRLWNEIRSILKTHNQRKYYNRISSIIKEITGLRPQGIDSSRITKILDDFFLFDYRFDSKYRSAWSRKYFPNLRFIALKLIKESGITYPYHVPLMRTSRKKRYLEKLFSQLSE